MKKNNKYIIDSFCSVNDYNPPEPSNKYDDIVIHYETYRTTYQYILPVYIDNGNINICNIRNDIYDINKNNFKENYCNYEINNLKENYLLRIAGFYNDPNSYYEPPISTGINKKLYVKISAFKKFTIKDIQDNLELPGYDYLLEDLLFIVLYNIDFIPNFANIIKEQPHKNLLYFFYNELLINGIGEQFMV